MWLSIIAASRLCAAVMACMSPVSGRFSRSIGTSWLWAPPAAPPLMPNVGPIEGWRIATVERLPICDRACPRPTVVVVLPSPSGVGVIAETTTYLALGPPLNSSIASSLIFATSFPYGSRRYGPMPILAATSGIGSKRAWRAIWRSVGNSTFTTQLLSFSSRPARDRRQAREHLAAPPLRRLDLVEREHVKTRDPATGLRDLGHQRPEEAPRVIAARAEH